MPAPGKLPGGSLRTPPGPHLHGAGKGGGRVVSVGLPEGFDSSLRRRRGLRPPIDASPAAAPALLLLFLCPLLLLLLLRGEGHSPLLLALPALARHRQDPLRRRRRPLLPLPAGLVRQRVRRGRKQEEGNTSPSRRGTEHLKRTNHSPQNHGHPAARWEGGAMRSPAAGAEKCRRGDQETGLSAAALPSSSFSSSSACHHPSLGQHRHGGSGAMESAPASRSGRSGEEGTLPSHLRPSRPERGGGLRGRQRYKCPPAARRCRRSEVNRTPAKPGVWGALRRCPQSRR